MIFDKIENIKFYTGLSEKIANALKFLSSTNFIKQADGKYPLDGDNIFYIVQRYQTKPFTEGKLEVHRKYIDIQYVISGTEISGHALLDKLVIDQPYDKEKDRAFYHVPQNINNIILTSGTFAIFFPHDAHMPGKQLTEPTDVLKVVVKVSV